MVAAAFIGPGTVTTATAAGAQYGIALLWAVFFSVFATMVLQELALRSALVTDRDLAPLVRDLGAGHWWRPLLLLLIVLAIGIGNSAYQSGNLVGAALGLDAALGGGLVGWVLLAAAIAATLIWMDRYALIERVLVGLVMLMAMLFLGLAVLLSPQWRSMPPAQWWPAWPDASATTVLALIGTTVVPYNLFLHATAARRRWQRGSLETRLAAARFESALSIALGGALTAAIVIVASTLLSAGGSDDTIFRLVAAVDTALPGWGGIAIGLGLFAAGLTSAIAAPVSAGWAVCGALGWSTDHRGRGFRAVALTVLLTGVVFAVFTQRPVALIIVAQAANALLLPVIVLALLLIANRAPILGVYVNRRFANSAAMLVLAVVLGLAIARLFALVAR